MELPAAIAALPSQTDVLRDRLVAWCEVNSGSQHLAGLARMAELLTAACRELGADVTQEAVAADGRVVIRARMRPAAPRQVLLSGHYDTVYAPDHAFQRGRCESATMLIGPGVSDMKGGLVVLLAALAAFERSARLDTLGWEVLLTPDEEIGSVASRPRLEAAARRHSLALVFEAARENGDLVLGRKGSGTATVTCRGRASHAAAAPERGRNAIVALSEFLVAAHGLPARCPGVLVNVGAVRGGGPVNVVPDLAEAKINIRISQPEQAALVAHELDACAAPIRAREGYALEIDLRFNSMPMQVTARAQKAFEAWRQCALDLSLSPPGGKEVGGGSDANLLSAAGVPCLDGLGPIGGSFHTEQEWVDLASLAPRAQIAALFLHRLAGGEIELG